MTACLLYRNGDRDRIYGPTLRELLAVAWELGAVRAEVAGITYDRDGLVWVWRPEAGQRAARDSSHAACAVATCSAVSGATAGSR